MMPTWGRQQCHFNKGNNAIADQGQQGLCNWGNNAILTTARTPAHQQLQQCQHHEGNNCNCNKSKDACASTAMMPSQQVWWHQLDDEQRGQQYMHAHTRKQTYHVIMRIGLGTYHMICLWAPLPAMWVFAWICSHVMCKGTDQQTSEMFMSMVNIWYGPQFVSTWGHPFAWS
jgi:hypothetical protein